MTFTYPDVIPTITWDGRSIDFNKSGSHKYSTGKKEALDVAVSLVKYSNGTVTEINGVDVASVKVDKKAQKAASVELAETVVSKTYKGLNEEGKVASVTGYIKENKTLGDLPFFTIKASAKNDAKSYKKDINNKLKDEKFYFGIKQQGVGVTAATDDVALATVVNAYRTETRGKAEDPSSVSADDIKKLSGNEAKDDIAEALTDGTTAYGVYDMDVDSFEFDNFTITKFNEKGTANITLNGYTGDAKKGYVWEGLKAINGKGKNPDYSLEDGTVASTAVKVLKFTDGGNFVYNGLTKGDPDDKGAYSETWIDQSDLAPLGFKWAFRKSPEEKSKQFRYGVFQEDNLGFVYSVDDAVDSVEEAF